MLLSMEQLLIITFADMFPDGFLDASYYLYFFGATYLLPSDQVLRWRWGKDQNTALALYRALQGIGSNECIGTLIETSMVLWT